MTVEGGPDQTVDEGEEAVFGGSFTDPGVPDTHTIAWDSGDGATASGTLTPTHVYADDAVYTAILTVTDDDGGVGSDTLLVTVNNVAPTVSAWVTPTLALPRQEVNFSGAFTDAGWLDTHVIAWDFGDGTVADSTFYDNTATTGGGIDNYAGTTYTGYNKATDVSGLVTFTLPMGGYRFRTDKDGVQYWSGASNHCAVPGCAAVTITVGSQAMRMPGGGMAVAQAEATMPTSAQVELLPGPSHRPPGLALLVSRLFESPLVGAGQTVITTRIITYTYDPLNRLTGAEYSTGESFAYQYDAVGNRTAMTDTTGIHTYTYDTANRLTSVDGVEYTWDARGNLTSNGTFTYAYNAAGRLVRAESITATLVYTYNTNGLRVAQSVDGDVTTFAWDWASAVPEMLSEGSNLYLVGHDTLGWWDGDEWAYHLPDALGSVRQVVDGAGAVVSTREWIPYGMEMGTAQAGLGYTGEWWDADAALLYLRARWYEPGVGRFMRRDPIAGTLGRGRSYNGYDYAEQNPINFVDPSGLLSNGTIAASLGVGQCAPSPWIEANGTCPGAMLAGELLLVGLIPADMVIAAALAIAGIRGGPVALLLVELALLPAEAALFELHMIGLQLIIQGASKPCDEIEIEFWPPWGFGE